MNEKLKPCPFCGSEAEEVLGSIKPTLEEMMTAEKNAKCSKTGCLARFVVCSITEWNTRHDEEKIKSLEKRLREKQIEIDNRRYLAGKGFDKEKVKRRIKEIAEKMKKDK